jgi:hypothetical protein
MAAKKGILGLGDTQTREQQRVWLAWSLDLFGLSIQYQPDKHFGRMNTPVERFSSNARFDGIGDCEDIAICMTHEDLCNLPEKTGKLDLIHLKQQAKKYKCIMVLGTDRLT